jgi:hypothetical protein
MNQKKRFSNLDAKLLREAILRSAFWGIAVGALVAFAAAVACWFLDASLLWAAIVALLAASLVAGVLFYFTTFRPSISSNAKRIDRLGLDERAITMVEYANDDSYIAKKQREDALAKMAEVQPTHLKLKISKLAIILCCLSLLLFAGMATVEQLSTLGILPTGIEVWQTIFPPEPLPQYTLTYEASKGGVLLGETEQTVEKGSSGEMVIAVADEGYVFLYWSDGIKTPYRTDENVQHSISVSAVFTLMENFNDAGGDTDQPDDAPSGEGDQETNNPDAPPSGGEKYVEVNQVIDGQTYYRDVIDEYYQKALEYLENDENIPEHIRKIIERYYSTIQ